MLACSEWVKDKKKFEVMSSRSNGEMLLIERENFFIKGLNREFIDLIDYSSKR